MTKAVNDEAPLIYGDGRQTRDFVYVSDVVQANLLAAVNEHASGEVFNVGTQNAVDINHLWLKIAALGNSSRKAEHAAPRPGDIIESLADIHKARHQLCFKPVFELDTGLGKTLAWYKSSA
jgi:nucleoside-diphosphate-sugar epimerase